MCVGGANIMDQGSRLTKPQNNLFNEIGCNPDSENKILVEDLNGKKMATDVFDRPVVLIIKGSAIIFNREINTKMYLIVQLF